ncbi:hypothetical protein OG471_12025 [Streptomyces sp. NBC_01336]|uniref:hypothetical protein n=1 Tax=Streptomyces sp. NBC_01336 TaxID=2903829 RepID=UPI002E0E149C|nr:hypothetical protein OG471_12025 [Streptomyces sp. NBC_01336]
MASSIPEGTTSPAGLETELDRIEHALATGRLTTVTGTGGAGRTLLAIHAAGRVRSLYRDGVRWADLAPVHDDELLLATVCEAVGLGGRTRRGPVEALVEVVCEGLAEMHLLLVLDSCEHVRPGCAHLLGEILTTSPGLTVLATSGQPLGVRGEQCVGVLGAGADPGPGPRPPR